MRRGHADIRTGSHRIGCTGSLCADGICVSGLCVEIRGEGEDCSEPATLCDAAYRCFSDGTCQVPLPLGSTCSANQECQNYPGVNSCIQGLCAPKSNAGEPCEEHPDCDGLLCGITTPGLCG